MEGLESLEKGIELVEYHEPVTFRYLFETKHRDAFAKASLCLVVRTKLTQPSFKFRMINSRGAYFEKRRANSA